MYKTAHSEAKLMDALQVEFNKKFFKLIIEHLIFSLKYKKIDLPTKSLRKLNLNQVSGDDSLLRLGR